jgi:flotillin
MKRIEPTWGLVSAAAHEHLVLIRNGAVVRAQQGGSVWKWPGDSVARIDTSVHRLQFTADQITRERVGVQVTGLAVFRVVAPLVAFRMLDLEDPDRHRSILEQMFVGATRRLVATLSLEDCLTRRKDALAGELMAEVAPVVSGRGQSDDGTDCGWGVAIDTIEIQDVRVLSAEVFERMQAPFRAELALSAVRAHAEVAAAEARVKAEVERAEEIRRASMLAEEQARIDQERARAREEADHAAGLERMKLEAEIARAARRSEHKAAELRQVAEMEAERARERIARERMEQEAALAMAQEKAEAELAHARRAAEAGAETARLEAEALRLRAEAEAEATRLSRASLDTVSEARLQEIALTQTAPELAKALRGAFGEITVRPSELTELVGAVKAAIG